MVERNGERRHQATAKPHHHGVDAHHHADLAGGEILPDEYRRQHVERGDADAGNDRSGEKPADTKGADQDADGEDGNRQEQGALLAEAPRKGGAEGCKQPHAQWRKRRQRAHRERVELHIGKQRSDAAIDDPEVQAHKDEGNRHDRLVDGLGTSFGDGNGHGGAFGQGFILIGKSGLRACEHR